MGSSRTTTGHTAGPEPRPSNSSRGDHSQNGAAASGENGGRGSRGPRKPKPGRSLAELRPDIAAQWHPTKNGELTPADISVSASLKFWWDSGCGHGRQDPK
jgi:hypothetical protein